MKTLSLAAVAVLVGLCTAQAQKTGRPNYDQLLRPPGAQFYHVPIATCEDYPEETTTTSIRELTGAGWEFPHDLRAVAASAFAGSGRGLVVTGLLVLICTPVLRVALTLVVFLVEKDRAYVVLSAIVLALLTLSFFLGKAGG